jgi:hypothetical protein
MKFPFQMNYIELKCMYLNGWDGMGWMMGWKALHHQKEVKAHHDDYRSSGREGGREVDRK